MAPSVACRFKSGDEELRFHRETEPETCMV